MRITSVLLAAGQGTRMKSNLPKVLHPICGQPMIAHALAAVSAASTDVPVVVVGHGADQVEKFINDSARCVLQEPQLGTGHAAIQAEALLRGNTDFVIVSYGDMPLLGPEVFQKLVDTQRNNPGPISLMTVMADDPRGFGRIIRKPDGTVEAIIEEYVATPEQQLIKELNVGAYCFSADWFWDALHRIPKNPKKGEYYLTDTIGLAVEDGLPVQALVIDNFIDAIGINTRVHLAEAEAVMRLRINRQHMLNGVTMIDPASTYIDVGIEVGRDTVIWPNTYLQGKTKIGEGCELGPNAIIRNCTIGNECKILAADLESAVLENHVDMGPFARLRKGAHLANGVHMGNFGEIKNSYLAPGVKMGHFSYIGDAIIGEETNIGAGTITCNYDGKNKHKTELGRDVFIGSDTMLVAPLRVGDGARTGAGAVVTKDVPDNSLAVGMPARVIRKLEKRDND